MSRKFKRGEIKQIVEEIADRIMEGERISIDPEVERYFNPKSLLSAIKDRGRMVNIIQRALKAVEKRGNVSGSLGGGVWGVPNNEAEVTQIFASKFMQLQGRNQSAKRCVEWADKQNLLPEGVGHTNLQISTPNSFVSTSLDE